MKIKVLKSYLFICVWFFLHGSFFAQDREVDSLLILLKLDKADTAKLWHLNELSWKYNNLGVYDSALLYADLAVRLSEQILEANSDIKVEEVAKKNQGASYNIIGSVNFHRGNYPEALKTHFTSLKIKEAIGDKKGEAFSYINIGNVYYYQGNYSASLKNYKSSLKIMQDLGNEKGIANSFNNIGNVFFTQGNHKEALENYSAALKIRERLEDKQGIATSYTNISGVFYAQAKGAINDEERRSKLQLALKHSLAAMDLNKQSGDKAALAGSMLNVGSVLTAQKKFKEGKAFLINAKELAKEIGIKEFLKEIYLGLAESDSAKGDYNGAFENHKLFVLYRDSLDNEETRKRTIQSQMNYDFEKKDAIAQAEHKKELENQQVLSEEKSRKQRIVLWLVSGFLVLVLFFAGVIFRSLKITRKQKKIIEEQKKLVEDQKMEVEIQKMMVDEHQKNIIDSITYARRIQRSLLPTEKYIEKSLKRLNSN